MKLLKLEQFHTTSYGIDEGQTYPVWINIEMIIYIIPYPGTSYTYICLRDSQDIIVKQKPGEVARYLPISI